MTLKEKRPTLAAELEVEKESLRIKAAPDDSPLKQGDLVLQFDGEPFFAGANGISFLRDYLLRSRGKTVELQILREGKQQSLTVPLRQNWLPSGFSW
jgi:S1-C subfamily serine protease